jgi:hypothetical protein
VSCDASGLTPVQLLKDEHYAIFVLIKYAEKAEARFIDGRKLVEPLPSSPLTSMRLACWGSRNLSPTSLSCVILRSACL